MRCSPNPSGNRDRGRVYRRCGCRDDHRHTIRRAGFPDELNARINLRRLNDSMPACVIIDPRQSTADYLTAWLAEKELHLKPTTIARYRAYIEQDLIPALGTIPLDDLTRRHLSTFVTAQLQHGRGRVTVHSELA
ncbi:N-terminal phage integrase SAM-like domain-containing protein [Kitasatospora sp. NBC_01250]|uniref:N-terminal phage integrase SAM-like domain-containing protein n=1 Tax=Kitasatospora sp. NBC_01250 TaxID=2903571 RepID=UPI002E31A3BF|nr:N-terminal phage integrase SAM-like domain-containing protein [Kitasatospora sp. NBC_01250]